MSCAFVAPFLAMAPLAQGVAQDTLVINGAVSQRIRLPEGPRFTGRFAVTADESVVLQTMGNLYDLGAQRPLLGQDDQGLTDFAISPGQTIVAIRGTHLALIDRGQTLDILELHRRQARVSVASDGVIVVYGGLENSNKVLAYQGGPVLSQILTLQTPPVTIKPLNGGYLVAFPSSIVVATSGHPFRPILVLPDSIKILDAAVDDRSGIVYFSVKHAIYALKSGTARLVAENLGESIQVSRGILYICNPGARSIVRISGIPENLPTTAH